MHRKDLKSNIRGGIMMIVVIVLIIIVGGIAALISFNPNNINEKVLKNIPLLKSFVPVEEKKEEELDLERKYYDYSKPRLKEAVFTLEGEKKELQSQNDNLKGIIVDRDKEIETLKEVEAEYLKVKKEKTDYEEAIINKDTKAFAEYYKKANPERSKEIFRELLKEDVKDKKVKTYISNFETMDSQKAAKILEELVKSDLDIVIKVVNNLDSEIAGKILENMDAKSAARITKKITG